MTTGDIRNKMVIDLPKPKLNLVAAFNLFLMIIHGFLFLLTATWNNDYGSLTWFSFHRRTTFKLSWELSHTRVQNFIWLTFMMIKKNLEQLSNEDLNAFAATFSTLYDRSRKLHFPTYAYFLIATVFKNVWRLERSGAKLKKKMFWSHELEAPLVAAGISGHWRHRHHITSLITIQQGLRSH